MIPFSKTLAVLTLSIYSLNANAGCYSDNVPSHKCRLPAGDSWCSENYTQNLYAYNTSCMENNNNSNSSSSSSGDSNDLGALLAIGAGALILGAIFGGDDSSSSSSSNSSSSYSSNSSSSSSDISYTQIEFDPTCGLLATCQPKNLSISGGPGDYSPSYSGSATGAIHKGYNGLAGTYNWSARFNDRYSCSGSFYLSGKKQSLRINTFEDCRSTTYNEY